MSLSLEQFGIRLNGRLYYSARRKTAVSGEVCGRCGETVRKGTLVRRYVLAETPREYGDPVHERCAAEDVEGWTS